MDNYKKEQKEGRNPDEAILGKDRRKAK